MQKNKFFKNFFFFCIIFFLSLLYMLFILPITGDEIWNYGFSYNITRGLMIYRDFNCLQMPLYFFIGSFFIQIFGSYLISMHIFDCLVLSFLILLIYRRLGLYKSLILFPVILFNFFPNYSYFCLFLLFIIFYFLDTDRKWRDEMIAFLIGFIFITKQNIGICMLIPLLFYSKNKLKSLFIYLIPFLIVSIYLIFNHAFYDFINCCFLGIFDFQKSNFEFSFFFFLEVFVIFCLLRYMVKKKIRDEKFFFILIFQINTYPIFDFQHFFVAFIPILYYIVSYFDFSRLKLYYRCLLLVSIYLILVGNIFETDFDVDFSRGKFYYLRNMSGANYFISSVSTLINQYRDNYDDFFLITPNSYLIKLYNNIPIGRYDLLLNGNMGYHGDVRVIKEIDNICKKKSCVFFVEEQEFGKYSQFSEKIYDYVLSHYQKVVGNKTFFVYDNKKNT